MPTFDLAERSVRDLNSALRNLAADSNETSWTVEHPLGKHAIAAGLDRDLTVDINGHVGYYCAGMNKHADITIHGNAGVGVAENMMSGRVHVKGDASQSAGATAHGGLLLVDGNASARCGISLKGADIIVKGSVGHMSAFMAQAGSLVVFGDAGDALGDSLYEAKLFVRGTVASCGADCIEKPMDDEAISHLAAVLAKAGLEGTVDPAEFKRYGSARQLYHFKIDNVAAY